MFIKLIEFDTGLPTYVNSHRISCIYRRQETTFVTTDGGVCFVKEKPEEIFKLIRDAQYSEKKEE